MFISFTNRLMGALVQVILVGHDFGGACMSYAMEMYPSKISKAVFISAAMLANAQSTLDLFNQQVLLFSF